FREYCRSTRAHNTVVFDANEQSEVWGTFRMARRAGILETNAEERKGEWRFEGSYAPYYDRNLVHSRRIERNENGDWMIADSVTKGALLANSYVHLHPRVRATTVENDTIECERDGLRILIEPFGCNQAEVVEDVYFPDFGLKENAQTIRLVATAAVG